MSTKHFNNLNYKFAISRFLW